MPALARRTSAWDIDYVSGENLPKNEGGADVFLETLRIVAEFDSLTGDTPTSVKSRDLADAMQDYATRNGRSILDILNDTKAESSSNRIAPRASFEPLQEWEGYVIDVGTETFVARLLDLTSDNSIEHEEAEFYLQDLSTDDLLLLQPGAIFRWAVGYETRLGGTRKKVSSLVFRRLPIWRPSDMAEAKAQAREYLEKIEWK